MKRDIVIDADHILYFVAESNRYKADFEDEVGDGDDFGEPITFSLKPLKEHFKSIVKEYVKTAEVEIALNGDKVGKVRVVLSDTTNFRYEIFPSYKAKRPEPNELRTKLKKWAYKKYTVEPNTEADDVVAYYVRKGGIGFTTDKDLLYGVAGKWFNCHHMAQNWVITDSDSAEWFFKQQVLAGDGVDGIPSIEGVGLITADKLLSKRGSDWKTIETIFVEKGYDKEYMLTMARLVSMTQWTPKYGIKLWNIPKS